MDRRYTAIDLAYLAVIAVISGIIFTLTWDVYYFGKAIGGPVVARILSYGLWFIGAPLAASLIRKPFSAFLGETLGALVETIIPTYGGFTNLIYGIGQGLASELGYALFKYKRYGALEGIIAGALAGFPCVALDAILFGEIYPANVMVILLIAAIISGGIYGGIAAMVTKSIKK